jgi:ferrous iron transport protein B
VDSVKIENKRLSDLQTGQEGIIIKILGHGAFRNRITEMGFVKGKKVLVIKNAPLRDPVEYEIMDYKVSLRRSEAKLIEVIPSDEENLPDVIAPFEGTIDENTLKFTKGKKGVNINVALVGNPNSGKTTLFNYASGSHERVGNYGGVTIDSKEAHFEIDDYRINIVDLPGTYSLTEYTPEEMYVRKHIIDDTPDVVVNVIDASNLERNLFLTTQLIDMNIKVVIALNMFDELEEKNVRFDFDTLGKMMGIPIIPTVSSKGVGIDALFKKVIDVYLDKDPTVRHIHINYGESIENTIRVIQKELKKNLELSDQYSTRYLSIKLIEGERTTRELLKQYSNHEAIISIATKEIEKLEKEFGEKAETVISDAKYGFIAGALGETYIQTEVDRRKTSTELDNIITHKIFGIPIFLFFMWVMFQATFSLGSIPMAWIDAGVNWLGNSIYAIMPNGPLRDLICRGVIGGVGGVIIFLPNILILFFFISLMEDTGYMARASFIMDRVMHKIGLHGKSFIPLIMGFGCNVPAVMATRTLENRKDRLLTMIITPFMSCSARLPVYVLLISAFFPKHQGVVLFSIYGLGIFCAVIVGLIMKKTVFAKEDVPFVMELPPYRVPTLRSTSIHMWHKAVQYVKKMGTVILVASVIIWALGYYPREHNYSMNYDKAVETIQTDASLTQDVKDSRITALETKKLAEHQENSYIGKMGHFIEPAIAPLGFDWRIGVSIITGLAAKEIVVSTMGVLYQVDLSSKNSEVTLKDKIQAQEYTSGPKTGQRVFSPLIALTMMVFVLIYFPCVAVIAAIKKEGNWKWALFTMTYTTMLAWILAFLTHQIGGIFL